MFVFVVLAFLVLPILEIAVIIQVGKAIGGWETIGLMILVSLVGAWMVRREGLGLIMRIRRQLAGGTLPTNELVDGLLVAVAGALMLTPGFLTDAFGLLLLFPPTRAAVRVALVHRFGNRVKVGGLPGRAGSSGRGSRSGGYGGIRRVVDVGEARYRAAEEDPGPEVNPGP